MISPCDFGIYKSVHCQYHHGICDGIDNELVYAANCATRAETRAEALVIILRHLVDYRAFLLRVMSIM